MSELTDSNKLIECEIIHNHVCESNNYLLRYNYKIKKERNFLIH